MKGEARSILFFERDRGQTHLVSYPDESWGIVRQGQTICTWESDELVDCLRIFLAMAMDSRGGSRFALQSFNAAASNSPTLN